MNNSSTQSAVLKILKQVKAISTDDHFVYTSGKHGETYVNKDALYPHVEQTSQVAKFMAKKCQHLEIETVAAPALGGIILSQWVAYHLSQLKNKQIHGVYAEKDGQGGFKFSRGYDQYITNKKVLVLEDLTTTGESVKRVVEVVRKYEGEVVGVCVMFNRNPQGVNEKMFGAPFFATAQMEMKAYDQDKMPDWLKKRPVNTKVGHGREYLASKQQ